ncbi:MAG: hypothetical protein KKG99_03545 [Bacteroidetes bacterium]|nr:hypothetical protein [Bacteroidota bacterium]
MKILTRQQKRALMRLVEKKRKNWKVPKWTPMKFVEKQVDPANPEGDIGIFINDIYNVKARVMIDGMIHLSFHNKDNSTDIPWTHKQQIKNDICGEDREAIEIFPAMSRIVDTCNQFHLWVYPEGYIIPTGFPQDTKYKFKKSQNNYTKIATNQC